MEINLFAATRNTSKQSVRPEPVEGLSDNRNKLTKAIWGERS